MKNSELIAKLSALPPDLDVAIADVKLNYLMQDADKESGAGIYDQFDVMLQEDEEEGHLNWISIQFMNPMIMPDDDLEESKIIQPEHGGIILPH